MAWNTVKQLLPMWCRVVCVAVLCAASVAQGALDLEEVWKGELNLWEMKPKELKDYLGNTSCLGENTIIPKEVVMGGRDIPASNWYSISVLLCCKGEKETTKESLMQWAKLYNSSPKARAKKRPIGKTDEIDDRRLVKIELSVYLSYTLSREDMADIRKEKPFAECHRGFVEKINEIMGGEGSKIQSTRPVDAAGRRYSGILWRNDRVAILLEEVYIGNLVEGIVCTVARDEDGLSYQRAEKAEQEVTAAELKSHVVEQEGMVSIEGVPPGYGAMDSLFRYYRLTSGGTPFTIRGMYVSDHSKENNRKYFIAKALNISEWLQMGHKTKCGFEEIWNEDPKKLNSKQKARWRQVVLKSLKEGLPVMCLFSYPNKWFIITGLHETEGKIVFKRELQEDGTEEERVHIDDVIERIVEMYVFVPGGGKKSRKPIKERAPLLIGR